MKTKRNFASLNTLHNLTSGINNRGDASSIKWDRETSDENVWSFLYSQMLYTAHLGDWINDAFFEGMHGLEDGSRF